MYEATCSNPLDPIMTPTSALVLLAHGSRAPETLEELEALTKNLQIQRPEKAIRYAFLTLIDPDLDKVIAQLIEAKINEIRILPLFLFNGKHLLEDIPQLIEQNRLRYPEAKIEVGKALGVEEKFIPFLLDLAELPS